MTSKIDQNCLGMMMDSQINPPFRIKTDLNTVYLLISEMEEFINDLELIGSEYVEMIDILMLLKAYALMPIFKGLSNKSKYATPGTIVNLSLRSDDALFLSEILSIKSDYLLEIRVFRSLMNEMVSKNPVIAKLAMPEIVAPIKKTVAIPKRINEII